METSITTRSQWFAVQTRYRREQRVAGDLTAKGIETYLPLLREVHAWKDRRKTLEVPAFGGYLFARFEENQCNRVRVLETTGVVRLLGHQGELEPVPDSEIESLRLSLGSGTPCMRHPYLASGMLLRIERGPLKGLEGRLVRMANALRLVICVASVGQAVAVEVARGDVAPIGETETAFAEQLHRGESRTCEVIDMRLNRSARPTGRSERASSAQV
ncbi:MAG: UpxY family transcription antiterminator [Acidobacteriaceae bacterium]|nr:UpxY family transcription antiterminator [Acidobacteriaceae bacterium]